MCPVESRGEVIWLLGANKHCVSNVSVKYIFILTWTLGWCFTLAFIIVFLLLFILLFFLLLLLSLFLIYILFTTYYLPCSVVESLSNIISHNGSDNKCVESWFSVSTDADPLICAKELWDDFITFHSVFSSLPVLTKMKTVKGRINVLCLVIKVRVNNFLMLTQFVDRWSRLLHGSHNRTMRVAHCVYMWLFFVTFSCTHLWSSVYIIKYHRNSSIAGCWK